MGTAGQRKAVAAAEPRLGRLSRACDEIVLATADPGWASTIDEALSTVAWPELSPERVGEVHAVADRLLRPARLWIIDEALVAPFLARRHEYPREQQPGLLVRFGTFDSEHVIAMIESGARGCLPSSAGVAEVREAVRAVLNGELWLSRHLFAAVLEHLQGQAFRHASPDNGDGDDGLTGRQREIVACVSRGMSNKQIGRHLGISPMTVKTHMHNIFERVGVEGRTLLALRASGSGTH